jgi:hypothetical protein
MARQLQASNPGMTHNFNRIDYMNRNQSFSNHQFGYSNIAMMNSMPQSFQFSSQFPNMSLYAPSTESSRNSSITGGMSYSNFPSIPAGNHLPTYDFNDRHSGDVGHEEDGIADMPGEDIFFVQDGDYIVDN